MNKFLLLLSLYSVLLSASPTHAQDTSLTQSPEDLVFEEPMKFKNKQYASLKWKPSIYPEDGVTYDVFYYIPRELKNARNNPDGFPLLIFLHGGGGSTTTPEGSISAINLYKDNLINLANALNVAVVLPSGTGMNWGTHTSFYMRSLIKMLRNSLNVNPNLIGIAGHSMGGMAMTRNFYELADQVAFVMPLAAGLAETYEQNLRTHYNTPYYHLQGRKDHFDVFVTRCEAHAKSVSDMEAMYNQKTKFTMELSDDDHSSVLRKLTDRISKLFETPRDLYQSKLYGHWNSSIDRTEADVGKNIRIFPRMRYFWLEATEFNSETKNISVPFIAEAKNNVFSITVDKLQQTPKRMRIYLSSKMVDLNKTIEVYVNGKRVHTRMPAPAPVQIPGQTYADQVQDASFLFEDKMEFSIP